jgi:hypothetical protein
LPYLFLDELAVEFDWSEEDVDYAIFSERCLRLAIPTDYLLSLLSDVKELSLNYLHDGENSVDILLDWGDPYFYPPKYLYVDLDQIENYVVDAVLKPAFATKVTRDSVLRLSNVSHLDQSPIFLDGRTPEGETEIYIDIPVKDLVVTQEEIERYIGPENQEDSLADAETERSPMDVRELLSLQRLVGALAIALNRTLNGGTHEFLPEAMVVEIETHLQDEELAEFAKLCILKVFKSQEIQERPHEANTPR